MAVVFKKIRNGSRQARVWPLKITITRFGVSVRPDGLARDRPTPREVVEAGAMDEFAIELAKRALRDALAELEGK